MKKLYTSILLLTLAFSACKKSGVNAIDPPVDNGKPVATNLNNDLLLKLVNDQRIAGCKCGSITYPPVAVLTWNNLLAGSALAHSKDMNKNNFLEHTSSNGATIGDRYTLAGYKWVAFGENIGSGQTSEQQIFTEWIKSEGHCKNIMSADFKEMGAARDGNYWTQDLGAR